MKKLFSFVFIFFSAIVLVGCASNLQFKQNLTTYNMELTYNDQQQTLSGKQTTQYINSAETTLTEVKFHLYANAFRENSKAEVVSLANTPKAYPNGKSYGNIDISCVKLNNQDANFEICGEDNNILNVKLTTDLYPNETVDIYIEYTVCLANINHRLGYGDNAVNLCNFYPIACVYDQNGFMCDLYNSNGDPFYSDVANYNVQITYPNTFKMASTGNLVNTVQNTDICAIVKANCVRDFAIILSENFEHQTANYQDRIKINYYFYGDQNSEQTMTLINQALAFFEEKIGEYPYSQISVVETNFVHGGMEYPNLVLISDALADYPTYQTVVVHELCHQWWYGVVGNNQFDYGWIDEGLTEFSTVYFFDQHPQYEKTMQNLIRSATFSYVTFAKVYTDVQGEVDTSMNRALDEFNTEPEYVYNTYVKGTLMFSTIYELVGEKNFTKALKYYYSKNAFNLVTPQDVINCFSKGTGKNLEGLFTSWIEGKVKIIAD